jgi:hypothetical protein
MRQQTGLYETANWTVNGVKGALMNEAASLWLAIEKAAAFSAAGRQVVAVAREQPSEIVVFADQIRILTSCLSADNETADGETGSDGVLFPDARDGGRLMSRQ